MYTALSRSMSGANEAAMFMSDEQRVRVYRSVVEAFYSHLGENRTVFDSSRLWSKYLPLLSSICPGARVICCVRNPSWILDSVERLVQTNALSPARVFKHEPASDVYTRVTSLMQTGFVGVSLKGLRQAWFGEHASSLIAVRYESLTRSPQDVVDRLYELLQEERFEHDFENVHYEEREFDRYLGLPGMHTVRNRVSFEPRKTILPPDLFRHHDHEFWNVPGENPRNVTVL